MKFQTNFDFELQLFGKEYPAIRNEFDYTFLWTESSEHSLSTNGVFDDGFLNYIKLFREELPKIERFDPKAINWWGDTSLKGITREVNRKNISFEIAEELKLNHPQAILVENIEDLKNHVGNSGEWLLKQPHSFSGIGHCFFNSISIPEKKLELLLNNGPCILEPELRRIIDLGMTFGDEKFWVQNLNTGKGSFRGGITFKNKFEFPELISEMEKVGKELKLRKVEEPFEVDGFSYLDGGEIKNLPLVEVNTRKTMGGFIHKMGELAPDDGIGVWILFSKTELKKMSSFNMYFKYIGKILYEFNSKKGVIMTTPLDRKFQGFYICADSLKEAQFFIKDLWKGIGKEGKKLPVEFVINF